MIYVAEAIRISNSESLALIQGFIGFCLTVPAFLAGYFAFKSRTAAYRRLYLVSLSMFLLNITVFGLLSGVGTRFTDGNLIDASSWIFWTMLVVLLASALGVLASLLLLAVEQFRNRKSIRSRKT